MKISSLFLLSALMTSNLLVAHAQERTTDNSTTLNITAISTANGASVLQCWSLKSRPTTFAAASNYYLGGASNVTYSIIPPRTVVGLRNAPYVQ